MSKKTVSWKEIENIIDRLFERIPKDATLVALGRGGMIPASLLAHKMWKKSLEFINYSRTKGYVFSTLENREFVGPVIFVDDVIRTGGTMEHLAQMFKGRFDLRTCALFRNKESEFTPDYEGEEFTEEHLYMPWQR